MDLNLDLVIAGRALLAALLGAVVGLEREIRGKDAGVRTYAAVSIGACTFALISSNIPDTPDPTRIAAQVVSGIGFLGAGVILRNKNHVIGLTTAATLWSTASVGLAVAFGFYFVGIITAATTTILLLLPRIGGHLPNQSEE